jgi:hypothetical protein
MSALGALLVEGQRTVTRAPWSRVAGIGCGGFAAVGFLVTAASSLLLVAGALNAPNHTGGALAVAGGISCAGFVGVAFAAGLAVLLLRHARAHARREALAIRVKEGGVELEVNGEVVPLPWSEITGVYTSPRAGRLVGLRVDLPTVFLRVAGGGLDVELRDVPRLAELAERVVAVACAHQVARGREVLDAGGVVRFGDVSLSPRGISGFGLLGAEIAWSDLKGLSVGKYNMITAHERLVPVGQKGPLFIATPFALALFQLAEERRRAAQPG